MTEAEPRTTGAAAHLSGSVSGRSGKILLGVAAAVALAAGGLAAFRRPPENVAQVQPQPPAPTESQTPSVDDVIAKLEKRLADNPDDAEGWRMLGWSYFQTERFAEAATALRKATKLDPDHAETFSFLGESLVLASNTEGRIPRDARVAFDKALKLDPKDARARYFKAVAMDLAGNHRRAINAWFALLADTPDQLRSLLTETS